MAVIFADFTALPAMGPISAFIMANFALGFVPPSMYSLTHATFKSE